MMATRIEKTYAIITVTSLRQILRSAKAHAKSRHLTAPLSQGSIFVNFFHMFSATINNDKSIHHHEHNLTTSEHSN
jgi:hypothetical protein